MKPSTLTPLALALALACGSAQAADPSQAELIKQLKQLAERVDKLEKRNAELEGRLAAQPAPALEKRVTALEADSRALDASLATNRISDKEPEIATRLKYLEAQVESHKQPTAIAAALEGIKVEGSVTGVAQRISDKGRADDKDETQLGWRGDVGIHLPGGDLGDGKGKFFVHLRMGQGDSFTGTRPTFTGAYNSVAFQQADVPSSNTNAIVAQAWYQLTTPLGEDADSPHSLEVTVGKIDPFVFFDQNSIADDESTRFLNNVFVHNPMLDSGGAVGADDYGFAPGVRLAYVNKSGAPETWGASIGVFGTGEGAAFGRSFTKPFVIGQLEAALRPGGLDGIYRAYAWHNGQYEGFSGDTGSTSGWGVSIDQKLHEDFTLFTRYGHGMSGQTAFDRALTVGGELTGNAWGRGADGLGFAFAWLRSSQAFRAASAGLEDFAYGADGAEQVAELYYRWYLNAHLSLSPDLQVVRKPGANEDGDTITTVGVRARYAF